MNLIYHTNEPITEHQLVLFEQHIGAKLPDDYRRFLIEYNGGCPTRVESLIPEINAPILVSEFYGVGTGPCGLKEVYSMLDGRIPNSFISIADDPGGHEYLIGLCGTQHEGQIYFWLHDQEAENPMDICFFVANSFTEFFDGLKD